VTSDCGCCVTRGSRPDSSALLVRRSMLRETPPAIESERSTGFTSVCGRWPSDTNPPSGAIRGVARGGQMPGGSATQPRTAGRCRIFSAAERRDDSCCWPAASRLGRSPGGVLVCGGAVTSDLVDEVSRTDPGIETVECAVASRIVRRATRGRRRWRGGGRIGEMVFEIGELCNSSQSARWGRVCQRSVARPRGSRRLGSV
jgi:hypothetical protein